MAEKIISADVDIQGSIKATTVPNSTGTIVTYNTSTRLLGTRTNAQIIADLGLATQVWANAQGWIKMASVGNGNISYTGTGSVTGGGTSTANQAGNTNFTFDLTASTKFDIAQGVTAYSWGRGLRVDGNGVPTGAATIAGTIDAVRNASMYASSSASGKPGGLVNEDVTIVNFTSGTANIGGVNRYSGFDLVSSATTDQMWFRRENLAAGKLPWLEFIHSGNIGSYLPTATDYWTTNTNQTGLIGNKTTSGIITSTGGFVGALTGNASTATTLATARTINGTSFNGSANIVTALWGTARNITIGNTTKSVDGSGNVSWNLAEIGASGINHTHPISDIVGLQTELNKIGNLPSLTTTNKNNLVDSINEVNAKTSGLDDLGGRNYLTEFSRLPYQGNSVIPVNGFYVADTGSYGGIIFSKAKIEAGYEYIISFEYKTTDSNGWYTIATPNSATPPKYGSNISLNLIQDGELHKRTIKFTATVDEEISICLLRQGTSGTVYYKKDSLKIEKGSIPTDWTPAIEDQVSDWNETDSTKYSFIKNKPTIPTIPTVNNGQLTLSTGTGLSGSATFTANQAGGSTFSVTVASTHKLPTITEWNALPTTNTITRLRGTTSGTYTSGDLTLINGAGIGITQSGVDFTITNTLPNIIQTLSLGTTPGNIALSGGGGNVILQSLMPQISRQDSNVRELANDFRVYRTNSGNTNYPATNPSTGFRIERFSSPNSIGMDFNTRGGDDEIWYKTFNGATNEYGWYRISSREWVNSQNFSTQTLTAGSNISIVGNAINNTAPNVQSDWNATSGLAHILNKPTIPAQLVYTGSNGINVTGTVISPTYGTTAGTIAQGNDVRINNGQTAFGWGDHSGLYSSRAGLGGTSNSVLVVDTRNINPLPTTDLQRGVWFDFKQMSVIGTGTDSSTYGASMTFVPYSDDTGNNHGAFRLTQSSLATSNIPQLFVQKYMTGAWHNQYRIWHEGNLSQSSIDNWNTAFGWGNHASAGYALASQLSGYVPTSRTITINGVAQNLSANRTWTIPDTDTITRLRGTASGTFTSGDLTLLAGANTTITQSGANITIASTNTNTTYTAGTGLSLTGTVFGQTITTSGTGTFVTGVTQTANGFQINLGTPPNTNTTYTGSNGINVTGTVISPTYGTAANTIAQGNDARINNGQTAFNSLGNYVLRTNLNNRLDLLNSVTGGSDFYYSPSTDPDKPTGVNDGAFISMSYDSNLWYSQLYSDWRNNEWYVRTKNSGTWNSFQKLIHTGNISTYIPAQVNIIQGAGISVTGTYPNLTITNSAPNATHTGDVTGATALTIANNAVTFAKMQNIATQTFLGRATAGTGNVEALTVAQVQSLLGFSTQTLANSTSNLIVSNTVQRAALTGDVTAAQNSNATTIANSAVTNAKMANMAANTFKGRLATVGAPQDLTVAQMQSALGIANTTVGVNSSNYTSGAINLVQGTNMTITKSGNNITFNASGGGGGIPYIGTDNPYFPGPTAQNTALVLTSHATYGRPQTQVTDDDVGNLSIRIDNSSDEVRFYGSFDNVHTEIVGGGGYYAIDFDGIPVHIFNIIFQGGGGTVSFGKGNYSGDQINITAPKGQQINLQPQTNFIASTVQEVYTHANLIWDMNQDAWVLVSYE